ncbi:MAG: efflux RND transporter permease subunit [Candidatus Omnitrophica bacterium]|nr:efflux RND transporter permease subunit [Candidatus Omnitrophota bacterium]
MGIPKFSVKKPVTVIMIFCAIMLVGIISLTKLNVELYQNSGRGIISILTSVRGGMPPREVEDLVTRPIEEACGTVSNVKAIYSSSKESESRVTMSFETGTDMNFAALEVREKFAKVKNKLPREIQKPVIAKYDESESPIFIVAFTSDFYTPEQVRIIIEEELKSKVMRVQGVANVDIYGGRERKILVEIDKEKIDAYQISFERIMEVLGANNLNVLTGGIAKGEKEFHIRAIGEFMNVEDIANIGVAVTSHGSIIRLKQIARVVDSFLESQDYARLNLTQNVSMYIKKESLANTITVTDHIKKVIDEFAKEYEKKGIYTNIINNAGEFIRLAIKDVFWALLMGAILAMVIIFAFLNDVRSTFIIGISMPISVVATFIAMSFLNISINIMTLSGLTLAIGILVDSSIVVLENVFQRVQTKKMSFKRAVVAGSEEMWIAIFASTITTIVVFLPIIFIDKEIKVIYQGLAFTVTASLCASLFVALSIVPTLCSILPRKDVEKKNRIALIPIGFIKRVYTKFLIFTFRNRINVFLVVGVAFLLTLFGLVKKPFDIPSRMSENEFAVIVIPPPGANLDANDTIMKGIENLLVDYSEVETISTTVKKDEPRLYVSLIDEKLRSRTRKEISAELKEKADAFAKEVHNDYAVIIDDGVSIDASKQLVVNIFGIEDEMLEKLANEVSQKFKQVSGIGNIVMTDLRKRPEYSLVINKGRAALYGLTVDEIAQSVHAQMRGMRPTKYHHEGHEVETITRLEEQDRKTLDDLKKFVLTSKRGERVFLEQIASFEPSFGPTSVDKYNKFRYVFVKAKIFEGALETKAKELTKLLDEVEYPKDYFYKFGGEYPNLIKGKTQLSLAICITIFLIFMILASLFQSYFQPFIILFSIPLSSIGVWISLQITDKPLSQPVLLGMIMLAGIVVNNAIILVDHANTLRDKGMRRLRAIITSGQDRLRPILMTTASTVLGFLPLALGWSESSNLWSPLAITVVGGLSSSTLFTIFIVPNIYIVLEDFMIKITHTVPFVPAHKPKETQKGRRHVSWN